MDVYEKLTSPSLALNAHLDAAKAGDTSLLRKAFAKDARFVGTDDEEVWSINKLVALLHSTEGEGWEMRLTQERQFVSIASGAVSFLEFLTHVIYGPMRGSGIVCLGIDGQWQIRDYVLSFSVPNKVVDETVFLDLVKNH